MTAPIDPALTGHVNTALGPMFVASMMSPASTERFGAVGFDRNDVMERYFAFRSAPLGRATAETVIATFFNFAPRRIRRYIPRVWDIAEPDVVLDVLMDVVDVMMADALVDFISSSELTELAALLSDAAAEAFAHPEGRPLFAGIAGIPWPDAPHAQVWLGMHALREFRGDGHLAVLTSRGINGLEALVLHIAMAGFPPGLLRPSRDWPDEDWDATVESLRARGLLVADDILLSEQGRVYRQEIEHQTDVLSVPAYATIGEDGMRRILELAPPMVAAVAAAAPYPRG